MARMGIGAVESADQPRQQEDCSECLQMPALGAASGDQMALREFVGLARFFRRREDRNAAADFPRGKIVPVARRHFGGFNPTVIERCRRDSAFHDRRCFIREPQHPTPTAGRPNARAGPAAFGGLMLHATAPDETTLDVKTVGNLAALGMTEGVNQHLCFSTPSPSFLPRSRGKLAPPRSAFSRGREKSHTFLIQMVPCYAIRRNRWSVGISDQFG